MSEIKLNEPQLNDVIARLKTDGCEFFVNSQLQTMLLIPDDAFQKEWPVDSQRVHDLLTKVHYELHVEFQQAAEKETPREDKKPEPLPLLRSAEREFLLSMMREDCREGGRRHTEVEAETTERDPIVRAVLYHLNQEVQFVGSTSKLLVTLRKHQDDLKVLQAEKLPVFVNIFSRQLKRLIPVLRGYGVEVTIEHKEEGSHTTLKRTVTFRKESDADDVADSGSPQPSGEPSGETPKKGSNLPPTDGSDGMSPVETAEAKKKLSTAKGAAKESTEKVNDPSETVATTGEPAKGGA